MRAVLAFLVACVTTVSALINPILPGWNPDPTILRVGKDYFIVTSTFEQFPGHPIYHSTDLVKWDIIGHALTRPSQTGLFGSGGPPDGGIWAPTLRYHNGVYYLATGARHVYTAELRIPGRPFFVTTTNIFGGEWSDPTYIDGVGYDLDLFFDNNGDVYATWCGINNFAQKIYGIYQSKIDIKTGDSLTDVELIWTGILPNDAAARPEGPHLYYINKTYYLVIAEGGTSTPHRATVARGPTPRGPWEASPHNPFIYNVGLDPSAAVQWTGHADLVQTPKGDWFGTMLGTRPQGADRNQSHIQLGRETFLYPVTWTTDGWPIAYGGDKPITEHLPGVLYDRSPLSNYANEFRNTRDLDGDKSFYFTRTQIKKFASVQDDALVIKGNAYNLSDRDAPALLLRRQSTYEETFETKLEGFVPRSNLTEAGASVWYGETMHHDIAVTLDESGNRVIRTRLLTYPTQILYTSLKTKDADVRFRIVGTSTSYTLSFSEGSDTTWTDTATVDSYYLTVPPAGGFFFKGTGFGVYNTGNGKPTLVKARFAYWKQTPVIPSAPVARDEI
ncbi:glycosyl hydrolase [Auriculariales sp. MPI-PUGE-AT-0066]|nr:glycosyl hydrolase [Auriculariales sp. MPI-PUGE-AT-0066]